MAQNPKRKPKVTTQKDDELTSTYRSMSSKGKYRKKKNKTMQKTSAILIATIALIVVAAIFIGCAFLINNNKNGKFAEGTMIAGVNVGGKTKDDAISAVTEATRNTYTSTPMTITVLDTQITIDPSVSGAKLDVGAAVNAAFKNRKSARVVDITPYLHLNTTAIHNALDALGEKYSSTRSPHKYEVTGEAPNHELVVTVGTPEYGLDMQALYKDVINAYNNNQMAVTREMEVLYPDPIDLQEILDKYYKAPKDAYLDTKTGQIVEGVDGYGFNVKDAEAAIKAAEPGSTIKISFTALPPSVTKESLSATYFKDVLAVYTATENDSDADRNINLQKACEAINGKVINPKEIFSYNATLGERTTARGYRPGPSFENGKVTKTIGGGICQVSSALYYCAVMADLDIRKRDNHGYFVDYVPKGMDAAVSWGTMDFCFSNNTNHPIRIEATANGGSTTIKLLGTDDKDYTIKVEYEDYDIKPAETIKETYSANNTQGYKHNQVIQEGHTGFSVTTYRVKVDKETGEIIEKTKIATSTYEKLDEIVCVIEEESGSTTPGIGNGGVTDSDAALP